MIALDADFAALLRGLEAAAKARAEQARINGPIPADPLRWRDTAALWPAMTAPDPRNR